MREAEGRVDRSNSDSRTRLSRLRWMGATAASYALDVLFLGIYAGLGTIPVQVPLFYALAGTAISAFGFLSFVKGWNLRWRDPNLTEPLVMWAILMQLGVALAAPQAAFPFLANLFTVFAFGMLWLSLRDSVAVWSLGVFGAAVVFFAVGSRIGAPTSSAVEIFLMWLYFSLILGRCLLVSVAANDTRARLAESRRRLADTLEQVQRLSSRDELTRALNRRSLVAALERERSRAERGGTPFCIAMIDLDHFKSVNDNYGHAAGDAVLRTFSESVHDTMRATDVFGRYGGEEFLLILVGTSTEEAQEAVQRIHAAVAACDWRKIVPDSAVTLSAGIAPFRQSDSVEQLLHRADQALYRAKHGGRNRTIVSEA